MLERIPWMMSAALLATASLQASVWQSKVDPWILAAAARTPAEFLVFLEDQADLDIVPGLRTRDEQGRYVVDRLRSVAAATQGPLLDQLQRLGVPYRSFWVANMVWVKGDLATVQTLAERPDVAHLYANPRVELRLPATSTRLIASPQGIEWNIAQIGAPDFWAAGHTGQGAVIGGQDTGYDWDHPALINQYRGWNGVSADHDYNWHDSIHSGGGSCGADSPEPCDDGNHGTHTLGTMVGDDGGANQIGVAPGARWIGCRNMDEGIGTPATYSECFQFFMAPTRIDGSDPDPTKAPHVINNSWTCPDFEGCTDPNALLAVVENTRAAGIVVVASAGNDGDVCSSVNSPPAIYHAALTVGATDIADNIARFSSRGGVAIDGSNRLKPNVSAPGVNIRSSINNGSYDGGWNGTSMAGPHVAGQVALLISAVPELAGRVETLETCIESSAVPLTLTSPDDDCSGIPANQSPNNAYGRGRIELALPLPFHCSAAFIFSDDFETKALEDWRQCPGLCLP